MKELKKLIDRGWEKTDDNQYVFEINEKEFLVINIDDVIDSTTAYISEINLNDYTECKILEELAPFGYARQDYNKLDNQIIAECISENHVFEDECITLDENHNEEYLIEYFNKWYDI